MIGYIVDDINYTTIAEFEGQPKCGEDFCDDCGDCLGCNPEMCYDGGLHVWVKYGRTVRR